MFINKPKHSEVYTEVSDLPAQSGFPHARGFQAFYSFLLFVFSAGELNTGRGCSFRDAVKSLSLETTKY